MVPFLQSGRPVDEVIGDLVAKRVDDLRWQDGKTFGMVYDGGPEVREVAERAAELYLHENALQWAGLRLTNHRLSPSRLTTRAHRPPFVDLSGQGQLIVDLE